MKMGKKQAEPVHVAFNPPPGMTDELAYIVQKSTDAARGALREVGHGDLNVVCFVHSGDMAKPPDIMSTSLWVTPQGEKMRVDELRDLLEGEAERICIVGSYGPDRAQSMFVYAEDHAGDWIAKVPIAPGPDRHPTFPAPTMRRADTTDMFRCILYPLHD